MSREQFFTTWALGPSVRTGHWLSGTCHRVQPFVLFPLIKLGLRHWPQFSDAILRRRVYFRHFLKSPQFSKTSSVLTDLGWYFCTWPVLSIFMRLLNTDRAPSYNTRNHCTGLMTPESILHEETHSSPQGVPENLLCLPACKKLTDITGGFLR